jgi:hypothetical protein
MLLIRDPLNSYDINAKSHLVKQSPNRSLNAFEIFYKATCAKLVAKWKNTEGTRRQNQLKLSMVNDLRNLEAASSQSKQPENSDTATIVARTNPIAPRYNLKVESTETLQPIRDTRLRPALEAIGDSRPASVHTFAPELARCMTRSYVNEKAPTSNPSGLRSREPQQKEGHQNSDLMDKHRKASAARQSSHCQRDRKRNSGQTPEQYLALKKKEAVARVMDDFNRWLDKRLAVITYAHEAAEASGNNSSGSTGDQNTNQGQPDRPTRGSKRQFDRDDPHKSPDGGDDNDRDGTGNKRAKKEPERNCLLACPFYKNDPRTYGKKRTCCGPGWPSIHRLKEHLFRNHRLPKHRCPRCTKTFGHAKELAVHLRDDERCEKLDYLPIQGIDDTMEAKLRTRKKHSESMTDEQKWGDIYLIIFPHANPRALPSPHYERTDTAAPAQSAAEWRKVKKIVQKNLPSLVQKRVERQYDRVQSDLIHGLPDIIRDGLFELLKDQGQSPTETAASSPRSSTPGPGASNREAGSAAGGDARDASLDLDLFFDNPENPLAVLGSFESFAFNSQMGLGTGFDDCGVLDHTSDSGYASIGSSSNHFF